MAFGGLGVAGNPLVLAPSEFAFGKQGMDRAVCVANSSVEAFSCECDIPKGHPHRSLCRPLLPFPGCVSSPLG